MSLLENTVRYKQFDITVNVALMLPSTRYRVMAQARRLNEAQPRHTWLTSQEFDSEKSAYEFGLLEARMWIDKEKHD